MKTPKRQKISNMMYASMNKSPSTSGNYKRNIKRINESLEKLQATGQLDKAEQLLRYQNQNIYSSGINQEKGNPPHVTQSSNRYGTLKSHMNNKEYFINFDNKNKFKPSLPVHKSIAGLSHTYHNEPEETKNGPSNNRFSKNVGYQDKDKSKEAYEKLFNAQPHQLTKVDMNDIKMKRHTTIENPSNDSTIASYTTTQHTQEYRTNTLFPEGTFEQYNIKQNANKGFYVEQNVQKLSNVKNLYGFNQKLPADQHPMKKKGIPHQNKSNSRFNKNPSIERKMLHQQNPMMTGRRTHANTQISRNFNQSEKNAYNNMAQYQTISHPQEVMRNNSNNPIKKKTHARKKTDIGMNRNYEMEKNLPENLTRSYARFKLFENNSQNFPVKDMNQRITSNQRQHSKNKIIGRQFAPNKRTTLDSMATGRSRSKKRRTMATMKNHSKYSKKTKSTRNHYNQMKTEFMKNLKGNKKTMGNPQSGHFLPSNKLGMAKTSGTGKSNKMRRMPAKQNQMKTQKSQKNFGMGKYSKRTNSKQVHQMIKMSKHKSVSNLHKMGSQRKIGAGSTRKLTQSGIGGMEMNKSTTWNNKF
jgi:hypothetical protein